MSGKTRGVEHVESLEGSEGSKERLKMVLRTLQGEVTVEEACRELSVSEGWFHAMRRRALEGALGALEGSPPGRKPGEREDPELAVLRGEVRELRRDLEAARIREEIALVMPHVIHPPAGEEKGGPRTGGRRRPT